MGWIGRASIAYGSFTCQLLGRVLVSGILLSSGAEYEGVGCVFWACLISINEDWSTRGLAGSKSKTSQMRARHHLQRRPLVVGCFRRFRRPHPGRG